MVEDVFGLIGTVQAGTFRVEQAVAEGGFGVVYRAHHTAFRAPVALKCLKVPRSLSAAERGEFEEQFRAEAELLFQLSASTPTVVRPLQVGVASSPRADFIPFMALEWLEGRSLDELIVERRERGQPPLSLTEVVQLLRPVAYALDNAHRFPGPDGTVCILHRDMKPENVFIAEVRGQKTVRILDFGIAKVKSAATAVAGKASAQASVLSAFTPGYGAPEQWVPKRYGQTGPWTDVYGFALTVIETICGHPPIDGDQAAMMGAALDEKLRPTPRNCGAQVSDDIEAVFELALGVDPRERFQAMSAFWNALESAVERQSSQREAPTRLQQDRPLGGGPGPSTAVGPSSRPPDPHGATRMITRNGAVAPAAARAIPDLIPAEKKSSLGASRPDRGGETPPAIAPTQPDEFDEFEVDRVGVPMAAPDVSAVRPLASNLELDGLGIRPGPVERVPRAPLPRPRVAAYHEIEQRRAVTSVKDRLVGPLGLVALGSLVAGAGWAYQASTGEVFALGPIRPLFVAGPLVLVGLLLAAKRLFGGDD
jgi:serine/threonine protein kinase